MRWWRPTPQRCACGSPSDSASSARCPALFAAASTATSACTWCSGRPGSVLRMHTSTIRLADGRQLTYYDREPGTDRSAADKRDLPPLSAQSQMRHDVLQDEYVVVATHRQGRTHLPAADE